MQQQEITRRVEFLSRAPPARVCPSTIPRNAIGWKERWCDRSAIRGKQRGTSLAALAWQAANASTHLIIIVPLVTKGDTSDGSPEILAASRGSSSSNSVSGEDMW